jgi:hypothetical protein
VTLTRDPVSEQFDRAAAALLQRAHARTGAWTQTTIANPSPAWMAWGAARGRNLLGPDDAPSGTARTAWARSFIRSVYWVHRNHYYAGAGVDMSRKTLSPSPARALRFRVGTVRIRQGRDQLTIGRIVQVRLDPGGDAAWDAAEALPDSRRYLDGGPSASYPEDRWWQE